MGAEKAAVRGNLGKLYLGKSYNYKEGQINPDPRQGHRGW